MPLWHLDSGAAVVTTSDGVDDVEALLTLAHTASTRGRTVVVGAAAAPGLTGLLARLAADDLDTVEEIHVAIHGTGGPACARQHHDALGSASRVWYDGVWQERPGGTGRELCWFPDPIGAHDCYRAAPAGSDPAPSQLPRGAQRITARITATRRDRLTARLPMLRPPHPEALAGAVRVEVRGTAGPARSATILGVAAPLGAMAGATAAICAGRRAPRLPAARFVVPGQAGLPTTDLLRQLAEAGLTVHRFVGTASQTSW